LEKAIAEKNIVLMFINIFKPKKCILGQKFSTKNGSLKGYEARLGGQILYRSADPSKNGVFGLFI